MAVWEIFLKEVIFELKAEEWVDEKSRKVVQVEVNICKDPVKRESIASKGPKY